MSTSAGGGGPGPGPGGTFRASKGAWAWVLSFVDGYRVEHPLSRVVTSEAVASLRRACHRTRDLAYYAAQS